MQEFAVEEPGNCRKTDMRVGSDIDTLPGVELRWPHSIEKNERTYELALSGWQYPANAESTKVTCPGRDCLFDCILHTGIEAPG